MGGGTAGTGSATARRLLAVAAACLLLLAGIAADASAARTYVTLTFDDGLASEYQHNDVLASRGVRATYFVNTNKLGLPGWMTWEQVRALADGGNEIGGHTLDHRALPSLSDSERERQVCDDRSALLLRGYDARNFAYPHGQQDAASRATVQGCGYDSARTTGGFDYPGCCVYSERLRPRNAYAVRALMPRLNTPLSIYQDLIERARDGDGGWIPLVFHDLCEPGACDGFDEYSVDTGTLAALLDWIAADPQLTVRTTAEVLAIGSDTTPPQVTLDVPAQDMTVLDGTELEISASATDATGIRAVDLLVDGELADSDEEAPYRWPWTAPAEEGVHTLQVRARDEAGNTALSEVRTITVEHDHVAPEVSLTTPAQDLTVLDGTVVPLLAQASDAVGVTRVDFLADGMLVARDHHPPYDADWTAPEAEGPVVLEARAYDARGNEGRSASRTITVEHDHVAPVVELTMPADDLALPFGGDLRLAAAASDAVGVTRVDFLADGVVVASDDEAPYEAVWEPPAVVGRVVLRARASDARANEGSSTARAVNVYDPTPPQEPRRPPVEEPPVEQPPQQPTTPVDPPTPTTSVAPPVTPPVTPPLTPPVVTPDPPAPSPRIARVQQRRDGAVVVTVKVRDNRRARTVRLLVDGRVARTRQRPPGSFKFTLRPRAGTRVLVVEAQDAAGGRHRSPRVRVSVPAPPRAAG